MCCKKDYIPIDFDPVPMKIRAWAWIGLSWWQNKRRKTKGMDFLSLKTLWSLGVLVSDRMWPQERRQHEALLNKPSFTYLPRTKIASTLAAGMHSQTSTEQSPNSTAPKGRFSKHWTSRAMKSPPSLTAAISRLAPFGASSPCRVSVFNFNSNSIIERVKPSFKMKIRKAKS